MREPERVDEALPSIARCVAGATARLKSAGIEIAGNDARRLLAAATGLTAVQLLARPEQVLTAEQTHRFAALLQRRCAREPVSRILGERDFYGRTFKLSSATLDPRPDSETVVNAALDVVLARWPRGTPLRILDVGTGSGCLLLSLLCELPQSTGLGTDISEPALATAKENSEILGVRARAQWRVADALDGIQGPFDLVISNPPYIRSGEIAALDAEVRLFDPKAALDGGDDGLRFYRRIAEGVRSVMPKGWLALEVGHDQADQVADLLLSAPCTIDPASLLCHRDVAGKRRCLTAGVT